MATGGRTPWLGKLGHWERANPPRRLVSSNRCPNADSCSRQADPCGELSGRQA